MVKPRRTPPRICPSQCFARPASSSAASASPGRSRRPRATIRWPSTESRSATSGRNSNPPSARGRCWTRRTSTSCSGCGSRGTISCLPPTCRPRTYSSMRAELEGFDFPAVVARMRLGPAGKSQFELILDDYGDPDAFARLHVLSRPGMLQFDKTDQRIDGTRRVRLIQGERQVHLAVFERDRTAAGPHVPPRLPLRRRPHRAAARAGAPRRARRPAPGVRRQRPARRAHPRRGPPPHRTPRGKVGTAPAHSCCPLSSPTPDVVAWLRAAGGAGAKGLTESFDDCRRRGFKSL